MTFDEDISDLSQVTMWLFLLASRLGARLRKHGYYAGRVTVKFRSPDFKTWTRATTLDIATNQDLELFLAALKILEKEKTANLLVRLIGITADNLSETRQVTLFDREEIEKRDRLYKAMDRTRARFGLDAIYPATIKKLIDDSYKGGDHED